MTERETQPGLRSTILPITKLSKPIDTQKVHGHLSNKRKRNINFADKTKSNKIKMNGSKEILEIFSSRRNKLASSPYKGTTSTKSF